MGGKDDNIRWTITGSAHTDENGAQWTSSVERGYTATILFTAPGTFTLTISNGVDPDVVNNYPTRGLAKNAFRKFLFDK